MKTCAAIVIGLLFSYIATGIVGNLFGSVDGRAFVPIPVRTIAVLISASAGAWWVRRRAGSWRRLIHKGCALGAAGWFVTIVSAWIYRSRVSSALLSIGLSQQDRLNQGMDAAVSAGLQSLSAGFCFGICVVGLLCTRGAPTPEINDPRPAGAAPSGPSPVITRRLVAAEVILAALLLAFLGWSRSTNMGLAAVLAAVPMLLGFGLLEILAVGGLIQGLRLVRAPRHRSLGAAATIVSLVPILGAVFWIAGADAEWRQLDARWAERRSQYRHMETFFRTPQELKSAHAGTDEIVLVFAGGPEARMAVYAQSDELAQFCNDHLVGEKLEVHMPDEEHYVSTPYVDVLYEGQGLERVREARMRDIRRGR